MQPSMDVHLQKTRPSGQDKPVLLAERYQVVGKISGGMGVVYLCRDTKTDQPVALKTFKPEFLSHRVARDLFLREGTMWVEMGAHPNIVRAYRVERWGDGREVYLVMEWIVPPPERPLPALRSWLYPGHPLPVQQSLLFALHITRGMKHACKKIDGLIHRDLKPENILVGYDGLARVTDFGLASTLSDLITRQGTREQMHETSATLNSSRAAAGTPTYMAPEQWRHQLLDERTDIYALGCILYEMLTGRLAANGKTAIALREQHLSGHVAPHLHKLPTTFHQLFHRMLAIDMDDRYADWGELETALEKVYKLVTGNDAPLDSIAEDETRGERVNSGKSYNMMGLSYLDIGKFDMSVIYFQQAVSIARQEKDYALEAEGLGNLGLVYLALGYYTRALEFIGEQLPLLEMLNYHTEIGRAKGYLGRIYRRMGQLDKALKYHREELKIARHMEDTFNEAAALTHLGNVYRTLNRRKKAETVFKSALAKARKAGDQVRVRIILGHVGQIYLQIGEFQEARTLFMQSLEIARNIGDRVGEGDAAGNLADLLVGMNKATKAIEYYHRALNISRENHDLRRQIIYLDKIASVYELLENVEGMLDNYQQAYDTAVKMGTPRYEAQALFNMGKAYGAMGNYYEAAHWYKEASRTADLVGDNLLKLKTLRQIGEAYQLWGDLDRTSTYYKQYLQLARDNGNKTAVSDGLMLLGDLYYRLRKIRLAQQYYAEQLERVEKLTVSITPPQRIELLVKLARVAIENKEPNQAIEQCKEALSLAQKMDDKALQAMARGDMALAYQASGKGWQAYRTSKRAVKDAEEFDAAHPNKNNKSIAWASYKFALVAYQQEKWGRALPAAKRAASIFEESNDREMAELSEKLILSLEKK